MKIENNDSKKIVVNTELAQALLEVRTRKGLTQKDLEDKTKKLIGVEPCSYQDISRIETQRFKRIEVAKIKTIEKALELKEGDLINLSLNGKTGPRGMAMDEKSYAPANQGNSSRDLKQPLKAESLTFKMNFCFNCGIKLPRPGMNFCPNCGEDLRS